MMLEILYSTLKNMENVSRSTDLVSDQDTDQDDNISRLTKVLGDKEMSAADIMSEQGLSHRPTFRINYLASALNKGII
ncbi:MAG: transcriptional regulator [Ruminococcus sp.]|nr:transcriptional regulator [Ruminococcus sp.]